MEMISAGGIFFSVVLYQGQKKKNKDNSFDLKDTIHDLLQKRVISKLFYVTLFLYISVCFYM